MPLVSLIAAAAATASGGASGPLTPTGALPFTFTVGSDVFGGGQGIDAIAAGCAPPNCTTLVAAGWNVTSVRSPLDANRTLVTDVYTDAPGRSGLQV